MKGPLYGWQSLPRRLYFDTGTLQTIFDYGGTIWEGETFVPQGRDVRVGGLGEEVKALRQIMEVNESAGFEFVVTEASLNEVARRGSSSYRQWVYDVLDTWLIQSDGQQPRPTDHERPGSVSVKDWLLLKDALAFRCDGFLTMERRLFTQAGVVQRKAGIHVLRPTTFWELLAPWARLF